MPIVLIDPRDTCGCGLVIDKDVVDTINILLKSMHVYVGMLGLPLNVPAVKDEVRRSEGIWMKR